MSAQKISHSPKPLVYIAGALTAARRSVLDRYVRIREGCHNAGFEGYVPHEDTGPREAEISPSRVLESNLSALNRAVAVVAELSITSHGVGIEIHHAWIRGIPVLGIARRRADISRMVLGHPGLRGEVQRYEKTEELPAIVSKMLLTEIRAIQRPRARIIALEGPDFVGKSTLLPTLAQHVESVTGLPVIQTTDPPWALQPWDQLQKIFKHDERISKKAETLLYMAARVDNYQRTLKKALETGSIVIADRFIDSWLAYQSVRLATESGDRTRELEFLLAQEMLLESFERIELQGLSIMLMATQEELFRRAEDRPDREEKWENRSFIANVTDAYEELYTRYPNRIVRIETTGRTKEDVTSIVFQIAEEYLKAHGLFTNFHKKREA